MPIECVIVKTSITYGIILMLVPRDYMIVRTFLTAPVANRQQESKGSLTVTLGSVNFSLDEATALMSHKKKWLKSKGLKSSKENVEAYLRLALNTFVQEHPINIPICQFSGCTETKDIQQFYSYEEGYVNLCKKHRKMNEGKTGHTVKVA